MHLNPSTFFPIHINVFREAVADGAVAVSVAWWQKAADNPGLNHFLFIEVSSFTYIIASTPWHSVGSDGVCEKLLIHNIHGANSG